MATRRRAAAAAVPPTPPVGPPPPGRNEQPPKKKRKTAHPVMTITTGARSNVVKFQWKIENFGAIRHSKKMLQEQQFTVALGAPIGVPCQWVFSLASETEILPPTPPNAPAAAPPGGANIVPGNNNAGQVIEWLEIVRKLAEVPNQGDEVCNSCSIKIKDKERKTFFKGYGSVNTLKINGYRTFKKVLRISDKSAQLPLVDGALVIDFTITTFANRAVTTESDTFGVEFSKISSDKLSTDLSKWQVGGPDSTFSDIKIISKEGREFHVHKFILSTRSPVFQAMFASNLSEHQSGIVQIDDLGGKALELMIKYIYNGVITDAWFHPDVIVELTYAAGKYQLTEVTQYLDNVLGSKGKVENAGALLALVEKLGMKKAEKELLTYVKNQAVPTANSYSDLAVIFGNSFGG